ncbi:MAG: sigma-70 family RNA polymerase sigma factor [Candidatus Dormiibacterota bacterium]
MNDDEAAFSAALVDASEAALRAILSLGLAPSEAADVLQEASIRAWRHREQRRGDFRPWFLSIAYREARRPRRRWLTLPAFWVARGVEPDTDQQLDEVLAALRKLPRRQRLVLSLRSESGLSTKEVAQAMGISEPAAKQLLARARNSLRRALSGSTTEAAS